jgi:hypothetical protein
MSSSSASAGALPYASSSRGEEDWQCAAIGGADVKPVIVSLEICSAATASAWVGSHALGRHRLHPNGETVVLLFPGERYRLRLRNFDGAREVLAALYVDGRNAASGASVRLPPGGADVVWAGWRDAAGAEATPFVAAEMPTVDRRLDAAEAAAAAEVGGLRVKIARTEVLREARAHVFVAGGGEAAVRGSAAIAMSSLKKVDQGLGTAPPPAAAAVTKTITEVMGPTLAECKIQFFDDFGMILLLKDKADLPPVPGAGAGDAGVGKKRKVSASMVTASKKPSGGGGGGGGDGGGGGGVIDLT